MTELDRQIQQALRTEDHELLATLAEEPSVFEMVAETFRGRHRWMAFLGVLFGVVFMVLGILAAVRFFHATEIRDMLLWAAACVICICSVSMMKIWYWMELNKNALAREIKRLELQIARLASRLDE